MVSLLVSVLVALTPLAYASPPDPTYISGLWDDGDYDDVVILAAWASFVVDIHAGYARLRARGARNERRRTVTRPDLGSH